VGLERIVSIAQAGNDASERIRGKLGIRLERETADPACRAPGPVHVITKAQHLAA
jgi:hypothetical protein